MLYCSHPMYVAPSKKSALVPHPKLGQFLSTAICGNDILSSALYVAGIAIIFAGIYAPLVLLAVSIVLFFYRTVYREVVEALPVNGGAYNALLNATSKTLAALAGVMTILSYVATAVISAKTAVEYLFTFLSSVPSVAPFSQAIGGLSSWVTVSVIAILLFFAVLVIVGVHDSANVAAGIFTIHVLTLTAFCIFGGYAFLTHGHEILQANLQATQALVTHQGGLLKTLFIAFAASLLGVSGFESSANFIEEQKHGVFAKTLRNMTIGVAIFNPLIAAITLFMMSLAQIGTSKDFLLAEVANRMGGPMFLAIISIDAFLVLCGAVLTSFVGVSGLMNRMSLDRCLPSFLTKQNAKGSYPRVIITFFLLCTSILVMTRGDLLSLAGVYTISFLSVMTLFAVGNLILRKTRGELQRPYKAPFLFVVIALCSTLIGLMGNIAIDPKNTGYFLTYFLPSTFLVLAVIYRKDVYRNLESLTRGIRPLHRFFRRRHKETEQARIYVFIHHLSRLSQILNYIAKNENSTNVTFVHCKHHHLNFKEQVEHSLETLRAAGFFADFHYRVQFLNEHFSPELVERYANRHKIKKNNIFMGSIHHYHEFTYEELGGVRIIF